MARKLKGKDPTDAKVAKAKIAIYGRAGVGKTWAACDFPGVYYIAAESGASRQQYTDKLRASGGAYMGPEDGACDFATVLEELVTLAATKHDYKTVVIDSYTKLFQTSIDIEHERMTNDGRDMSKTFGAEKKPAVNASKRLVRFLDQLDMNVILICHQKTLWQNGEEIGVTLDGWDRLDYELDLVLRIEKQGVSRNAFVHKSRLEEFLDGSKFSWSYSDFADLYGKDAIESDVHIVDLATEEQLAQITHLIDVTHTDSAVTTKWFDKAGISRFEDMPTDMIAKCIQSLNKKLEPAA